MFTGVMKAKMLGPFACECGSILLQKPDGLHPDGLQHDQYARTKEGALIEAEPLDCRWAGAKFEIPTIEMKQVVPKSSG